MYPFGNSNWIIWTVEFEFVEFKTKQAFCRKKTIKKLIENIWSMLSIAVNHMVLYFDITNAFVTFISEECPWDICRLDTLTPRRSRTFWTTPRLGNMITFFSTYIHAYHITSGFPRRKVELALFYGLDVRTTVLGVRPLHLKIGVIAHIWNSSFITQLQAEFWKIRGILPAHIG